MQSNLPSGKSRLQSILSKKSAVVLEENVKSIRIEVILKDLKILPGMIKQEYLLHTFNPRLSFIYLIYPSI